MTNEHSAELTPRRTILAGAVWSVPVMATAAATPAFAASVPAPEPTDIAVTLQPTPPVAGQALRLTYRGTVEFDFTEFPAGSTTRVTYTGGFVVARIDGVLETSSSGTDPRVVTYAITKPEAFFVQGSGSTGATIAVIVYDADGGVIGSDVTQIP